MLRRPGVVVRVGKEYKILGRVPETTVIVDSDVGCRMTERGRIKGRREESESRDLVFFRAQDPVH